MKLHCQTSDKANSGDFLDSSRYHSSAPCVFCVRFEAFGVYDPPQKINTKSHTDTTHMKHTHS